MSRFQKGEFVQLIHNCEVTGVDGANCLFVRDIDRNMEFQINGRELVRSVNRSAHFDSEKKLNKTELLQKLRSTRGMIFSCLFKKVDGSDRLIEGIYAGPDEGFGRSYVLDLEKLREGDNNPMRLLDHRTIQYIILDGVKYYLK